MPEKYLIRTMVAIALATLVLTSFQLDQNMPAYSQTEALDSFGIQKIYPTAAGGNEWYVNMDDPRDDPNFRNLGNVNFAKNSDGSWRVSADQIRMEAWSPMNEKWLNVEITGYAKMESGSNELIQWYSRGGHHTSKDECLGSAYKARLYGNGEAAWTKEVTHPAYAGNRAEMRATNEPLEDRWIGFKAVIYNYVENGNTFVRLESYIDDDVTDGNGNLVVANNWKLASIYEDRGGWATNNSDFDSSCGRERDEILTQPGGTDTQNIAAFRSDSLTWSFKYLSVREIDPFAELLEEQPAEEPAPEEPAQPEVPTNPDTNALCNSESCEIIASQYIQNDGNIPAVNQVNVNLEKSTSRAIGIITIAILQENDVLATDTISTDELKTSYLTKQIQFSPPVMLQDNDFYIVASYEGSGAVRVASITIA